MTTITMAAAPFTATTPVLLEGFQSTMDTGNILHVLANGRTVPKFRASSLRKGTLTLIYDDEDDSRDAELMLAAGEYFDLTDPDRASIEMTFVVSGEVGRELDPETRDVWIVTVDFEELDV